MLVEFKELQSVDFSLKTCFGKVASRCADFLHYECLETFKGAEHWLRYYFRRVVFAQRRRYEI
jgi:hypothetical protein